MATPSAARSTSRYTCGACGRSSETWSARCASCGEYLQRRPGSAPARPTGAPDRTAVQESPTEGADARGRASGRVVALRQPDDADPAALDPAERSPRSVPVPITEVDVSFEHTRRRTEIEPLDRVLGGGLVIGSMILLSGEPGAGKSTLLMQMVAAVARQGTVALYASGEESDRQVAMRAHRVGAAHPGIRLVHECTLEDILWHAEQTRAGLIVVDSIHAVTSDSIGGIPGDPHQIKACSGILMRFAKTTETTVVVIAHVNGDGEINGPKTLPHAGDVTLMLGKLSDDPNDTRRELRAVKNRHGSTAEVGMFEMAGDGLLSLEPGSLAQEREPDAMQPIAQELLHRYLELGGEMDAELRDRIGGRLDTIPRGNRS